MSKNDYIPFGSYDPNIPAGLPSDFLDDKCPKMKICQKCDGDRLLSDGDELRRCDNCQGEGEVPMTDEEIQEEKEERNEPDNL